MHGARVLSDRSGRRFVESRAVRIERHQQLGVLD
jgi:hypothetical protein